MLLGTLYCIFWPKISCASGDSFRADILLTPLSCPCCACVQVQDETGWIAFFPGPFANITCGIDHTRVAPVIGCMWHTWHSDDEHFRWAMLQTCCDAARVSDAGLHALVEGQVSGGGVLAS